MPDHAIAARTNHDRVQEDRALFRRYARRPTAELRDAIVRRFMPLAGQLAGRYSYTSEPMEDLVQVAALGLVKAVDRYDVERGVAFTSYAVPTILGEIRRHFRDRTWATRVPRALQDLSLAVQSARADLETRLGRGVTVPEIAQALGVGDDDVLEALAAARAHRAQSLDAALDQGGEDDGSDTDLYSRLGVDDVEMERAEARVTIAKILTALPARSRAVLLLRFEKEMTQREIGEVIGVSQMQVSRILQESIQRLRACSAPVAARRVERAAAE
jgi:RNA polymerase sigma-B factor